MKRIEETRTRPIWK